MHDMHDGLKKKKNGSVLVRNLSVHFDHLPRGRWIANPFLGSTSHTHPPLFPAKPVSTRQCFPISQCLWVLYPIISNPNFSSEPSPFYSHEIPIKWWVQKVPSPHSNSASWSFCKLPDCTKALRASMSLGKTLANCCTTYLAQAQSGGAGDGENAVDRAGHWIREYIGRFWSSLFQALSFPTEK